MINEFWWFSLKTTLIALINMLYYFISVLLILLQKNLETFIMYKRLMPYISINHSVYYFEFSKPRYSKWCS